MDGSDSDDILSLLSAEFLTCRLCDSVYVDPRELPCQHTFCRFCLSRYVRNTWRAESACFVCPSCHVDINLPSPQLTDDAFQANVYIARLVRTFASSANPKPTVAPVPPCHRSAVSGSETTPRIGLGPKAAVISRNTTVIREQQELAGDQAFAMQLEAAICRDNTGPNIYHKEKVKVNDSRTQRRHISPRQPTTTTRETSTALMSCYQCDGCGTTLCSLCIANASKTTTQVLDQNCRKSRGRQNQTKLRDRPPPSYTGNGKKDVISNRLSSANNSREASPIRRQLQQQPQSSQTNVTTATYIRKESVIQPPLAVACTSDNCRCAHSDGCESGTNISSSLLQVNTSAGFDRAHLTADINGQSWSFVAEEVNSASSSPPTIISPQGSPRQQCCVSSKLPVRQATVNTRTTELKSSSTTCKNESGSPVGGVGTRTVVTAGGRVQVKDTCERHPGEVIVSLCIDCRSLLCSVCLETVLLSPPHGHQHDSHFIIQLSVAADIITNRFDDSVRETRQCLDQCRCHVQALKTQTLRDISKRCTVLQELIMDYEEQLTKEVEGLIKMEDEAARKEQAFNELVALFNTTVARQQNCPLPHGQSVRDDSRQLLQSIDIFRQVSSILQDVRGLQQEATAATDTGLPLRLMGGLDMEGGDRETARAVVSCLIGRLGGGANDDHALDEDVVAQMKCLCQQAQASSLARMRQS